MKPTNGGTLRTALPVSLALMVFSAGLSGCGGGGGSGADSVSGTITGMADPVAGLFDDTYRFESDLLGAEPDLITGQLNAVAEPYNPIAYGTLDGSSYTMNFPDASPNKTFQLVVWNDTDGNGFLSLTTETGCFPMKTFDSGTFAVTGFTYLELFGQGEWTADYYDGAVNHFEGLSTAGTGGYNVTIP